jgi:hypothetical protein
VHRHAPTLGCHFCSRNPSISQLFWMRGEAPTDVFLGAQVKEDASKLVEVAEARATSSAHEVLHLRGEIALLEETIQGMKRERAQHGQPQACLTHHVELSVQLKQDLGDAQVCTKTARCLADNVVVVLELRADVCVRLGDAWNARRASITIRHTHWTEELKFASSAQIPLDQQRQGANAAAEAVAPR